MNIKSIFKTMTMAIACLATVAMASCSKDDDNKSMAFSASKVVLAKDSTKTVSVSNCTTPLTAKSSDSNVATVTVKNATVTVKGVKVGSAIVTVTDNNKQTGSFSVIVNEVLSFSKTAAAASVGKEDTVTVSNGTAPYTAVVKDSKIATATVKDKKIVVKGVKAGTTTVTVTDKNKLTGVFSVTIK